MVSAYYQSPPEIIDFASRYFEDLNRAVENRMRLLGIPEEMIGIRYWIGVDEGAFTRFPWTRIGGNANPRVFPGRIGIAIDHGIFDANHPQMRGISTWATAKVADRADAAIAHEYLEHSLQPPGDLSGREAVDWLHGEALRRAPETQLPITQSARAILYEYWKRWRTALEELE